MNELAAKDGATAAAIMPIASPMDFFIKISLCCGAVLPTTTYTGVIYNTTITSSVRRGPALCKIYSGSKSLIAGSEPARAASGDLEPGRHAGFLVFEHVAMDHPLAGIVRDKSDALGPLGVDDHGVEPSVAGGIVVSFQ